MTKKLVYIYIDEGEYLYDQLTQKIYTFIAPHKFVGNIDPESFKVIPKVQRNDINKA